MQLNRSLLDEFAGWLAAADWDVALLQEAPPRWFLPLARRTRASGALALTARNFGACVRRVAAELNPDLVASGEGGSNQLLARAPLSIRDVRRVTLTLRPERRRMLFARVTLPEGRRLHVANLHATASIDDRAAAPEVERAAALAAEWSKGGPLLVGGDLNVRASSAPSLFERLEERHGLAAPTDARAIDHLLVRGLEVVQAPVRLPPAARELRDQHGLAIRLSDHAPVQARLRMK